MKKIFYDNKEFYASANSYRGFKSYFPEIFKSENFTAIYVLKGGPGSGKSTILKKLREYANESNLFCEAFKCSSDPFSLDGVIIENPDSRVAILDGTAPHARDANLPGVIDELVNLGEAFDVPKLRNFRDDIIKLNFEKATFYSRAYEYLSKSFIFHTNIKAEVSKLFDFEKCYDVCSEILKTLPQTKPGVCSTRLISSFSKFGYCTTSDNFKNANKKYCIRGVLGTDKLMISCLVKTLRNAHLESYVFPSALDDDLYEGVFFEDENIIITESDCTDSVYDSATLLTSNEISSLEKNLKPLIDSGRYYLNLAAGELAEASRCHFRLEEIYHPCVNFKVVDEMYENLLSKIKNIFQSNV